MGQYYNILTKNKNKYTVYDRSVNNEYMLAKLTEHSWIHNSFMDSICNKLLNNPQRIAWVGDYADDFEEEDIPNKISKRKLVSLYKKAYIKLKEQTIDEKEFDYTNVYLVNHTKKEFVDMDKYIKQNIEDGWCAHPLSLLTALGNGLGCGDYAGINEEQVGSWAWDKISFEDKNKFKKKRYAEKEYHFTENEQ